MSERRDRTRVPRRIARAVLRRRPYSDRWRSIGPRDLLRLASYAVRDVSTVRGGGAIDRLERTFAESVGSPYALLMNSGTAAIHSAYFAAGIGPGDEVIVPSYTFFASVAPLLPLGGIPVFCEIDPITLTADPDDVERRITPRTRAICVVHLWGNPARLDRFTDLAKRHDLLLIEDCSHAHGARYAGRTVGTWGDIGCFSLQGSKPVSGGEAGIAVTADPVLFDRMLALGHFPRPLTDQRAATFDIGELSLGLKYRAHLYAAVLALGGMRRLDELNRRRHRNYDIIGDELSESRVLEVIPEHPDATRGGFYRFVLRYHAEQAGGVDRLAFVELARRSGLPVTVDPYPPLHREALFAKRLWARPEIFGRLHEQQPRDVPSPPLPVTERTWDELITLAPFTKVSEGAVRRCARALLELASSARDRPPARSEGDRRAEGLLRAPP